VPTIHQRALCKMVGTLRFGPPYKIYAEIAFAESTCSRSMNFWILPVDVFGMAPNTTAFGVLNPDM